MKKSFYLLLSVLLIFSSNVFALHEPVRLLVDMETRGNAVATRSPLPQLMPHLDIPIHLIGQDLANRLDIRIFNSLVYLKDNTYYIRWVLNPEDTKWGQKVQEFLKEKGVDNSIKFHFTGYKTASRSYIVEDPVTGAQFSIKSSTNVTGGHWKDKKQPVGEAIDSRLLSDFLNRQNQLRSFKHFIFMDEPAIFKIDSLDQAVVIRDLNILSDAKNKKYFIPGFSVLHDDIGRKIARKNGSLDPYAYWSEHYIKVAGLALGELAARTGLQFDSPHSQNFLVEVDENFRPTGRLVLRDMADLYIDRNFLIALEGRESKTLKEFTQKENVFNYINAGFGPLHGNKDPSWVNAKKYAAWKDVFFDAFDQSFASISGLDLGKIKAKRQQNGSYFGANYEISSDKNFKTHFEEMARLGFVRGFIGPHKCQGLFAAGF